MLKPWRRKFAWIGTVSVISILSILLIVGISIFAFSVDNNSSQFELNLKLGYFVLSIVQAIPESTNEFLDADALGTVFAALGLAGTIVPAVYGSRDRRIKGFLIVDMTRYFFPLYGIIMALNLLLTLAGQLSCIMERMKPVPFFMIGACLSVLYALLLVLGTGLNERITKQYMRGYILDHIAMLEVSEDQSGDDEELRIRRSKFLANLTTYIADKISKEETPFCFTDEHLDNEICQSKRLITYLTRWNRLDFENIHGFNESFVPIFQLPGEAVASDDSNTSVYLELPVLDAVQDNFAKQIESAYEFWKIALNRFDDTMMEAKAACRMLYSLVFKEGKLHDNYVVMCSGLIIYLYKKYHGNITEDKKREVEQCAEFVDNMIDVFRSEAQFSNNQDTLVVSGLQLCGDMLFTIWAIAEAESYCSPKELENRQIRETYDRWYFYKHGYCADAMINKESTARYLCYGLCIIKQLPSVARKVLTFDQKRRLEEYVKMEMSVVFK